MSADDVVIRIILIPCTAQPPNTPPTSSPNAPHHNITRWQHSISIFAVNLDIAETQHADPRDKSITLSISVTISVHLQLFSDAVADRRAQIRGTMSVVTGVDLHNIELLSPAAQDDQGLLLPGVQQFVLVMRMLSYNSPYQDQHAKRLSNALANPESPVRMRVDAMFAQQIQTWTDFVAGSQLAIHGAAVHFPTPVVDAQLRIPGSRRLLTDTGVVDKIPAGATWNQTSSFFVRSYDTIENSDSMLAFGSTPGLFSRMCIFSVQYSLTAYCSRDEAEILHEFDLLFAGPILSASNGHIVLSKAVALAPRNVTLCSSVQSLSRRSASVVILQVEVIVYATSSDSFAIFATKGLLDAGIVQIVVLATKNTSSNITLFLDESSFLADGSFMITAATPRAQKTPSPPRLSTAGMVGICLGGCIALCLSGFFCYRWHQRRRAAELARSLHYHQLVAVGCTCYSPTALL